MNWNLNWNSVNFPRMKNWNSENFHSNCWNYRVFGHRDLGHGLTFDPDRDEMIDPIAFCPEMNLNWNYDVPAFFFFKNQ